MHPRNLLVTGAVAVLALAAIAGCDSSGGASGSSPSIAFVAGKTGDRYSATGSVD